jgi:Cys-tRNA(Pro)/Cys-tRNA(Cys) deacylase
MKNNTPVTQALEGQNIAYRFFRHPGKVGSLEQAAFERGQIPDQIVRSILFRVSKDEFIMVLMAGPEQISWSKLRRYLNQSRITMASEQEVLEVTGYPLGAVSPLGLPYPMRILVDQSVLNNAEISIGSGIRYTTIILKSADLIKALGDVEIGDFCNCEEPNGT